MSRGLRPPHADIYGVEARILRSLVELDDYYLFAPSGQLSYRRATACAFNTISDGAKFEFYRAREF